jgi:hypothetical protein
MGLARRKPATCFLVQKRRERHKPSFDSKCSDHPATLIRTEYRSLGAIRFFRARLQAWFAVPQPLNAQAVQDLIADGWLSHGGAHCDARVNAGRAL